MNEGSGSNQIGAKIVLASKAPNGAEIFTLALTYPRFIHAEVMTHRVFSRNAMSSRAVPVAKMIEQVRNDPAMPIHWGKNQPGMQADAQLEGDELQRVKDSWMLAAKQAADVAETMMIKGAHKQVANRILEPFQWMRTLVTSTEWENFFELRLHKDAQPEFRKLAWAMNDAMFEVKVHDGFTNDIINETGWHLPYVSVEEATNKSLNLSILQKISVARCARVSYLTHDNRPPSIIADISLYSKLVSSRPLHASPCEHQAKPLRSASEQSGNFFGWFQLRKQIEKEVL